MGTTELLLAARGEVQLASAKGRFFMAVSEVIDRLQSLVGAPLHIETVRTGTPQVFSPDTQSVVVLNGVAENGGVPYDSAFGQYSLRAGKLYELEAYLHFFGFTAPGTNQVEFAWTRGATELKPPVRGFAYAGNTDLNITSQPVAKVLYRPDVDEAVQISIMRADDQVSLGVGSFAIVREIG